MIPLTIISGYLGSGKTTLINQLLKEAKKPIGVLVNDFGELNIDKELINNEDSLTLSLSNGCVCCKLNDDLGISLEQMKELNVVAVVIEASGVAIPIKIANYGLSWPGFRLLGILSLVKGKSLKHLLSDKFVSKTVKAQITQADRVLLNRFEQEEKDVLSELTEDYLTEDTETSDSIKRSTDSMTQNTHAFPDSSPAQEPFKFGRVLCLNHQGNMLLSYP